MFQLKLMSNTHKKPSHPEGFFYCSIGSPITVVMLHFIHQLAIRGRDGGLFEIWRNLIFQIDCLVGFDSYQ